MNTSNLSANKEKSSIATIEEILPFEDQLPSAPAELTAEERIKLIREMADLSMRRATMNQTFVPVRKD